MNEQKQMREIGSERLTLHPLVASHAARTFHLWKDERLYAFIPGDPPSDLIALRKRFTRLESRGPASGEDVWLNWLVEVNATRESAGLVEVTLRNNAAQLAYFVFSSFQGQGVGTDACQLVLDELRGAYGAETVTANVDTRNVASIRLLERLGFKQTSTIKDADFFKGATSDEFVYVRHLVRQANRES
jgi:ribosomal-protein-alanine N-acetyltransferase